MLVMVVSVLVFIPIVMCFFRVPGLVVIRIMMLGLMGVAIFVGGIFDRFFVMVLILVSSVVLMCSFPLVMFILLVVRVFLVLSVLVLFRLVRLFGCLIFCALRQRMPFQAVEPLDIDKHGPIVRRARRLQDANKFKSIVLVSVAADAVRRLNLIAHFQA